MSIRIGSSGISLGAIRSLRSAEKQIAQSSARLASGLRINRAADDPAGLAISERNRAQIASLSSAQRNTQDGIGFAQIAQGGLSEIATLLSDARALAVQSSSGALNNSQRDDLDDQYQAILADIDSIAATTVFGSFNPLNDAGLQVDFMVGTQAGDTITVDGVDATTDGLSIDNTEIDRQGDAQDAIDDLDDAISSLSALAGSFGITENRLASRSRLIDVQTEVTSAAESRIRDADFAVESANLARAQVLQESSLAVLGQANSDLRLVLRLLD